jgi:hypothetical protein
MEVINFNEKKKDLTPETTVTIWWMDDSEGVEIQVTAFGNAEGSSRMMVFYNDNISEAPIFIANEEMIRYVELSPLETPEDETEEVEVDIVSGQR